MDTNTRLPENHCGRFSCGTWNTLYKILLIGPLDGWNNIFHTDVIATNDATYGKRKVYGKFHVR